MTERALFKVDETAADEGAGSRQAAPPRAGRRRMRWAVRNQIAFQECCLEDFVPADHQVRVVWEYVQQMDLTELTERIQAVEGGPGQAPADPRILMALWLYATLQGIGSARLLNRLCVEHKIFAWLCGGVSMNYHTLADFRTKHVELLDRLLTDSVAVLVHEGLVTLERVAQDGMKVRASAGAASFRRKPTLEACLHEAQEQVRHLREELEQNPGAATARQQAARQRAAKERLERVQRAVEQLPQVEEAKKPKDRHKARVSTTDPDARVMKMGDGGFRPAYNVQFATDTQTHVVSGVEVTNSGGDQGQLLPMVEQHEERYEQRPASVLVDGGFVKKDDIAQLADPCEAAPEGTKVYAPVMESKDPNRDPHTPRDDDPPGVAEWRQRMATPQAKQIYKQRASTAECTNAQTRNRNFYRVLVRGTHKVRALALWHALAVNLLRTVTLRAQRALEPATA